METTRSLVLSATLILMLGGAPLAFGETQFESFAVRAEVSFPPDPILPVDLSVGATFVPGSAIDLPSEPVTLTFYPPQPCVPPSSCEPLWQLVLPAGCFEERPGGEVSPHGRCL